MSPSGRAGDVDRQRLVEPEVRPRPEPQCDADDGGQRDDCPSDRQPPPLDRSAVGASAGSALGAVAWVFVTATARNGSLRTYCGPIIRPLPTTPKRTDELQERATAMADTETDAEHARPSRSSSSAPGLRVSPRRGSSPSAARPQPSSKPTRSSVASVAPSNATAGDSTSAATASSRRCGEVEQVWHEILPDEDFLLRPRHEPHPLPRQVHRLSAPRDRTR